MSQTLRDFRRPTFLNSLLFIGALSVETVPIVSVIGIIGIKPAQAELPHIPVPKPYSVAHNHPLTDSQTPPHDRSLPPQGKGEQQTSSFSSAQNQTSSITPATLVAASTDPPKQITPARREPIEQSENEFIRQMSGKTPVVGTVFHPPSQAGTHYRGAIAAPILPRQPGLESASSAPPVSARTTTTREILVTAKTNSDVGLSLFTSRGDTQGGCSSSRTCNNQPTAQMLSPSTPGSTTVPTLSPAIGGPPVTDPRGNPLEEFPRTNPPSSLPSERLPTQRAATVNSPTLQLQGVLLNQNDQVSGRARVAGVYPVNPNLLVGTTIDFTQGNAFSDSRQQGVHINELYLAASLPNVPNLRFVLGQLDLTSYFDRNSFAKDGATHFVNPVFQTNPALSATGISSRLGGLVNWSLTDNVEAKAAVFSSSRRLGNFSLDGFAGEIGVRYGNAIVRGTYATDRDAGLQDGFREIFQVPRGNGRFGPQSSDREESYGVNGEVFIPNLKLGLFARYGHYQNNAISLGGDTYSAGLNFLDLLAPYDRLGIAYGQNLSNNTLRLAGGAKRPDVLEVFYDFRALPNLRLGLTVQERQNFSETVLGVRVKTEFDVTPFGRRR